MNIAIMGAGLSGLACAIVLERHGIEPVILERRDSVGDRFIAGEAMIPVLNRPINDDFAKLSEDHGIFLQPLANMKGLTFLSENGKAVINGNMGFLTARGRHPHSLEKQLARQVKSKIHFEADISYEQLLKQYTHVVVATGDAGYSMKIQDFRADLTVSLFGGTAEGGFDRTRAMVLMDNNLAPKGYGYVMPFSEKEAFLAIGIPDNAETASMDRDVLWSRFFDRVCTETNQTLKMKDTFEVHGYVMGQCRSPRLGNTLFVGNCLGALMPAFGFGQLTSLLTGVYAAYDLVGKGSYAELVGPIMKSYRKSLVIRRFMEQLDNRMLDLLVASLDTKLTDYIMNNRGINPFDAASRLLKPEVMAYNGVKSLLTHGERAR